MNAAKARSADDLAKKEKIFFDNIGQSLVPGWTWPLANLIILLTPNRRNRQQNKAAFSRRDLKNLSTNGTPKSMRIGLKAGSASDCKDAEAYVRLYGINYAISWGKDYAKE